MTFEFGPWSGGFVDGEGNNIHPYKVESGGSPDLHESRSRNVHEGEAADPQNYRGEF